MEALFVNFYKWIAPFFLLYFTAINVVYTILLIIGAAIILRRRKEISVEDFTNILRSNTLPEITFIVPAYNEAPRIMSIVENLHHLSYRYKRIILVNDGSTDDTLQILLQKLVLVPIPLEFKKILPSKPVKTVYRSLLYPEVIVIDKENGNKYDALNAALNLCKTQYFITVDADTFVNDKDFEAIIRPIMTSSDTVAVGAAVQINNGCLVQNNQISTEKFPANYTTAMQSIEYLRTFLMREGWDYVGGNFCISGAFAVLATDLVVKIGGFAPTFANDLEIIVRLHRAMKASDTPYQIVYLPDPVAWTEGPQTINALANQRLLWHRGLLETLWFHKRLFFNPKYKGFGLFVYPFMVFAEALEPLIELFTYFYIIVGLLLGIVDITFLLLFLALTWGMICIFTLFSLMIEELTFKQYPSFKSFGKLFFYSVIEMFGYRQLTVLWRLQGFVSFFKRFSTIREDSKELNSVLDEVVKKGKLR